MNKKTFVSLRVFCGSRGKCDAETYMIEMKKIVRAVRPYEYQNICNFKSYPFQAWKALGGQVAKSHYPYKMLHGLAYNYFFPAINKNKKEARLRFVSGYSINFDTFPDYVFYEIIPIVWDCWPKNVPVVESFFRKYDVKTAVFTSSQTAEIFRSKLPAMNILTITEGVNVDLYHRGKDLKERTIDVLEVGRAWVEFFESPLLEGINHIKTGNMARAFNTDEEFRLGLADAKVTINVPRCDVDKKTAGDIDTLTQRYWECMLSRVVMVGRAPKELIDLIGYNPVVDWDGEDASPVVNGILSHIEDYQQIVDRNYETALRLASWAIRINQIKEFLVKKGYEI